MIEKSFQRQADKLFMKSKVKYTDGDNTRWGSLMIK